MHKRDVPRAESKERVIYLRLKEVVNASKHVNLRFGISTLKAIDITPVTTTP
jgi:hypothetical protein